MNAESLFYGYAFWVIVFWFVALYAAIKKHNIKDNLLQIFVGGLLWFIAAVAEIDDSIEGTWG